MKYGQSARQNACQCARPDDFSQVSSLFLVGAHNPKTPRSLASRYRLKSSALSSHHSFMTMTSTNIISHIQGGERNCDRRPKRTPLGIKSVACIVAIYLFTFKFQNDLIKKSKNDSSDDCNTNQSTNLVSSSINENATNAATVDAESAAHLLAWTRSSNFSTSLNLNKTHASSPNNSTHVRHLPSP